jgi:hypothetical protein
VEGAENYRGGGGRGEGGKRGWKEIFNFPRIPTQNPPSDHECKQNRAEVRHLRSTWNPGKGRIGKIVERPGSISV